jgi:CO/xanthine dehydrogenase Mo-binding subunit
MAEKARQARAGVEDGFDVGELDGRTHVVHSKSYSALIPGVLDQVAAERFGLLLEQVEVLYGDTLFPGAALAGGSQQTASIGASIIAAHRALVKELLKLAGNDSPLAGLGADEVGGLDGGLCALDDESRRESYVSILSRARRFRSSRAAGGSESLARRVSRARASGCAGD